MIKLESISRFFFRGTANEVKALDSVSLEAASGQFITLVGSNGAGKSSLLRVVSGQLQPDEGQVWLDGVNVTAWPDFRRAARVGQIDQNPLVSTAPALTIEENLALALLRGRVRGLGRAVTDGRRRRFRDALEAVGMGLEHRLSTRVGNLSGGQRQALALVMATIAEPPLLLLDEHTAALDPKAAAQVMEITERLVASRGLTTLMVTHNMEHAIRHGNRLLMMHRGRIILDLSGPEKRELTVGALIERFHRASGDSFVDDRILLS